MVQLIDECSFNILIMELRLIVRPQSALLKRDPQIFVKMDPYVIVSIGNKIQRSSIHQNGGKRPAWRDILAFEITEQDLNDVVLITVHDRQYFDTDVDLGACSIPVRSLMGEEHHNRWFDLLYKKAYIGTINVEFEFARVPIDEDGAAILSSPYLVKRNRNGIPENVRKLLERSKNKEKGSEQNNIRGSVYSNVQVRPYQCESEAAVKSLRSSTLTISFANLPDKVQSSERGLKPFSLMEMPASLKAPVCEQKLLRHSIGPLNTYLQQGVAKTTTTTRYLSQATLPDYTPQFSQLSRFTLPSTIRQSTQSTHSLSRSMIDDRSYYYTNIYAAN